MFKPIVSSYNRACQLELLIRSYHKYITPDPLYILYESSSEEYAKGYKKLIWEYPAEEWVPVNKPSYKEKLLAGISEPYTLFLCDDDFFTRKFDIDSPQMYRFRTDNSILAFSLRLGQDYVNFGKIQNAMSLPTFIEPGIWNWQNLQRDWGYPMAASSTIFKTKDIINILKTYNYNSPNSLENCMVCGTPPIPKMMCEITACCTNLCINKVQSESPSTISGNIPEDYLNTRYLDNYRINLDYTRGQCSESKTCFNLPEHIELEKRD